MNHSFLFSSLILFSLLFAFPSLPSFVSAEAEGTTGDVANHDAAEGDINLNSHWWGHTTTRRPYTTTTRRTYTSTSTYYVVGDPAFQGFHGQEYQVHGQDNAIYNLISSALIQLNTQFHFIKEGESRNIKELRQKLIHQKKLKAASSVHQHNHNHTVPVPPLTLAFSHPGQYMTGFAFKVRPFACIANRSITANNNDCDDSNITYLEIVSGAYEEGFQLSLEEKVLPFTSPQIIRYPSTCKDYDIDGNHNDDNQCDLLIDYSSPYRVSLHFRWLSMVIENSDYFLNMPSISLHESTIKKDIEIVKKSKIAQRYLHNNSNNNDKNYLSYIHGLLGCSYTILPDKLPYGSVDDYVEEEKNIFGDKFISNRF